MASRLEQAMQARKQAAEAACQRRDPKATDIIVSIAHGRCIVDYKDKDGTAQRFEHRDDIDEIGALEAEAATQRREVIHG